MDVARTMCPNSLRWYCLIIQDTGGWLVCKHMVILEKFAVYGTRRTSTDTTDRGSQGIVSSVLSRSKCLNHMITGRKDISILESELRGK